MKLIVVVQFEKSPSIERISEDLPVIIAALNRVSEGTPEMCFRSSDSALFAYLISSKAELGVIRGAVTATTAFRNADALLIMELGQAHTSEGFTRALTWLQRR